MRVLLLFLMLVFTVSSRASEDSGLYTLAPENASFVRVVSSASTPVVINGHNLIFQTPITPYYIIKNNKIKGINGNTEFIYELEKDMYYTLVIQSDKAPHLVKDIKNLNAAKAQLALYNIGIKSPISLRTKTGTEIIKPTQEGEMNIRVVNPIPVELQLYGDDVSRVMPALSLENRQYYSLFAFAPENIIVIKSEIAELP